MTLRKFTLALFCFLFGLLGCRSALALALAAGRPELRAFWVDGFNPGFKTPEEVDELLQRLHDSHLNAVFVQMRKSGDAYYQSHYEPWAADDPTHFDTLAYLITRAHAMSPPIAVHAWINTCAVGGGKSPFNIVRLHPDWLSMDPTGKDFDGEATKIDPGNPLAADWTFRIYLDVVRHYNVDGIHFDFVRYGGRDWGYNPVSVWRFDMRYRDDKAIKRLPGSGLPDPTDPIWKQWRRDQVTNLVRKVYAHAVAINPRIIVSGSMIAWGDGPHREEDWTEKSAAMNRVFQDWRGWLQEGTIDMACPMTYFQAAHTDWQRNWSRFIKTHQYRRVATVAVGNWVNTIPQTLSLMQVAREPFERARPYGVMLYSYAGTNMAEEKDAAGKRPELQMQPDFYSMLARPSRYTSDPPFAEDVPLPPMPWKEHPRRGLLKGFVLTSGLDPVDGAKVMIRGTGRTIVRYTDGSGFYAAVDLLPGRYRIAVSARNGDSQDGRGTVTAGEATTLSLTVGHGGYPLLKTLGVLRGSSYDRPARLDNLMVTLGSDTHPGELYVVDSLGVGARVHLETVPVLPFQPGDIVSVAGKWDAVDGEPALDRAVVRLTGIAPMSAVPTPVALTEDDLTHGRAKTGLPIQVKGTIGEIAPGGFIVEVGAARVLVQTAGVKDSGVESTGLSISPPLVGAQVSATGIVAANSPTEVGHVAALLPRGSDDVLIVAEPQSLLHNPKALGVALCTFRRLAATRVH